VEEWGRGQFLPEWLINPEKVSNQRPETAKPARPQSVGIHSKWTETPEVELHHHVML
jgi:hypothetical protein